jgi:hypothetical protein
MPGREMPRKASKPVNPHQLVTLLGHAEGEFSGLGACIAPSQIGIPVPCAAKLSTFPMAPAFAHK